MFNQPSGKKACKTEDCQGAAAALGRWGQRRLQFKTKKVDAWSSFFRTRHKNLPPFSFKVKLFWLKFFNLLFFFCRIILNLSSLQGWNWQSRPGIAEWHGLIIWKVLSQPGQGKTMDMKLGLWGREWFRSPREVLYEYIAILINSPRLKTISSSMQAASHWGIQWCYREQLMLDSIRPNSSAITIHRDAASLHRQYCERPNPSIIFNLCDQVNPILWPPSTTTGEVNPLCFYPLEPLGFLAVEIAYRTN